MPIRPRTKQGAFEYYIYIRIYVLRHPQAPLVFFEENPSSIKGEATRLLLRLPLKDAQNRPQRQTILLNF